MSSNQDARIAKVESRILNRRCTTCYGHAFAHVFVPDGEDEHAPEWNPTHCQECGLQLRTVRQIIGISEEEMFGDDPEKAG